MPRLPIYQQDAVRGNQLSGRRATPDDFGAGVSRAQAEAFATLSDVSAKVGNIERATKINERLMEMQNELNHFEEDLVNGQHDPETGNILPPPDPAQHENLFAARLEKIYMENEEIFGDDSGAFEQFKIQSKAVEYQSGFKVKKNATIMRRDNAATTMAYTLDQEAALAAGAILNGDMRGYNESFKRVDTQLNEHLANRLIDPGKEKALRDKWIAQVDDAHVSGLIRKDPLAALEFLGDTENWKDMPPEKRVAYVEQADREVQRLQSLSFTLENQAWQRAQRREEELGEAYYLEALNMSEKGDVSQEAFVEWALSKGQEVDRGTAKALYDIATGKETVVTPTWLFDSMWTRIERGDVGAMKELSQYYKSRDVNHQDYQTLRRLWENRDSTDDNYKRAREFIKTGIGTDDVTGIPGSSARQVKALRAYERWYQRNPEAEWDTHESKLDQLFEQYKPLDLTKMNVAIAVEAPLHFASKKRDGAGKPLDRSFLQTSPTNKVKEELVNAIEYAEQQFALGKIDARDLENDLAAIERWIAIVEQRENNGDYGGGGSSPQKTKPKSNRPGANN